MTVFSIKYNPYTVCCEFLRNGKELGGNSKFASKSEVRLQALLSSSSNWRGLIEEIVSICNDDEITIEFHGRKIDFDDLQYSVERYKGDEEIKTVFIGSENEEDIIKKLDGIFAEIKKKDLPQFKDKNKEGKDIFDSYEEVKNGIFEISVIATMSSGKSTLINSLLHTELLPSENLACTATITRIYSNEKMDHYEAVCYDKDWKEIHSKCDLNLDLMTKFNKEEEIKYIDIEGRIPAIPNDRIKLCLRDTPGPNNSQNEEHEKLTESIIKITNAVVLYVMNATQMEIKDDKTLLESISSEMKRMGKQSRDKFIFVVNKCDELDEEKGETPEYYVEKARKYLAGFGIVDPIIIPTSARLAFLIHKDNSGSELTRQEKAFLKQKDDFVEYPLLHFEDYAVLTPTAYDGLKRRVEKYHKENDVVNEALIHSGVPAVEETIAEYIKKYAYPMKIKDAIKDITSILDEINMKARFDRMITADKDKLNVVCRQIQDAKKKYNDSKKIYNDYKKRIDEFKLTEPDKDDELFKLENEMQKKTKAYDGKTKIDKIEAERLIHNFQEELLSYQKDCEVKLNREIDNKIFRKCSDLLEDYSDMIREIISNIAIDGFDFNKVSSFKKAKLSDVDSIISRHETNRYRDVTKWKDNPERAGFFGFFKFWKPKRISYTVKEKDGVDVNVKNVIVDILGSFKISMRDNISSTFDQAYNQVEEYKKLFITNIDTLDSEIKSILDKLDRDTKESATLEEKVQKSIVLADWANDMDKSIRTLLNF